MSDFGSRLKSAILKKHKNINSYAIKAGLSYSLVHSYVKGVSEPKLSTCLSLAKSLDVSPAWLAYGIGEEEGHLNNSEDKDFETVDVINLIHIKIEEWLKVKGREMNPETKARLARLIYKKLKLDEIIDVSKVDDFIEVLDVA